MDQVGMTMNKPTASRTEVAMVIAISLLESCSSSSPDICAEYASAFIPSLNDSNNAITPRSSGFFKIGYLSRILLTSFTSTIISPSGWRTATATLSLPRIITPSMTACPPTLIFSLSLLIGASSKLSLGYLYKNFTTNLQRTLEVPEGAKQ